MNRTQLAIAAVCGGALAGAALGGLLGARVTVPEGEPFVHDVRPGPGVSETKMLSAYGRGLAHTPGDTKVYVLQGERPGGTAVVLGGTHGNEIAGIVAAVVLVERARVAQGRLFVVPHANNSAVSYADPRRPGPEWVPLQSPSGTRRFKYGARRTRPEHEGVPDPERYRHPAADEAFAGNEGRNLARVYPGDSSGPLTRQIAAAIFRLVKEERTELVFDLHEAGPESGLAWMIMANPKNIGLGALAARALKAEGLEMRLVPSSRELRGVSHRELAGATPARPFLFETPNPWQDAWAARADVVDPPEYPLATRVGAQLSALLAVVNAYNGEAPSVAKVELHDVPTLAEVRRSGVGAYLK